jgi:hypothetical protein
LLPVPHAQRRSNNSMIGGEGGPRLSSVRGWPSTQW